MILSWFCHDFVMVLSWGNYGEQPGFKALDFAVPHRWVVSIPYPSCRQSCSKLISIFSTITGSFMRSGSYKACYSAASVASCWFCLLYRLKHMPTSLYDEDECIFCPQLSVTTPIILEIQGWKLRLHYYRTIFNDDWLVVWNIFSHRLGIIIPTD